MPSNQNLGNNIQFAEVLIENLPRKEPSVKAELPDDVQTPAEDPESSNSISEAEEDECYDIVNENLGWSRQSRARLRAEQLSALKCPTPRQCLKCITSDGGPLQCHVPIEGGPCQSCASRYGPFCDADGRVPRFSGANASVKEQVWRDRHALWQRTPGGLRPRADIRLEALRPTNVSPDVWEAIRASVEAFRQVHERQVAGRRERVEQQEELLPLKQHQEPLPSVADFWRGVWIAIKNAVEPLNAITESLTLLNSVLCRHRLWKFCLEDSALQDVIQGAIDQLEDKLKAFVQIPQVAPHIQSKRGGPEESEVGRPSPSKRRRRH